MLAESWAAFVLRLQALFKGLYSFLQAFRISQNRQHFQPFSLEQCRLELLKLLSVHALVLHILSPLCFDLPVGRWAFAACPADAKIIARFPASCRKRPFCEESCPPKGGQKNFFRRQRAHVRYLFPRIRASVGAKPTAGRAERPTHHTAINTPHSAQRTASVHQHIAHHAQALAAPGSNTAGVAFIAQRAPRCVSRCYHHRAHHHTPPLASASMSHTIGVTKTSSQTQS